MTTKTTTTTTKVTMRVVAVEMMTTHYGPEQKKIHRKNSLLLLHSPTSEGVSKVSKQANK